MPSPSTPSRPSSDDTYLNAAILGVIDQSEDDILSNNKTWVSDKSDDDFVDIDSKVVDNDKVDIDDQDLLDLDLKVDVDLEVKDSFNTDKSDDDVVDLDFKEIEHLWDSVAMPEAVAQNVESGNAFNVDQVNNLADQDFACASVSFSNGAQPLLFPAVGLNSFGGNGHDSPFGDQASGAVFSMSAHADGGETKMFGEIESKIGGDGTADGIGALSADGVISQEAFTQNIVLGSNVQYNYIDSNVAGCDIDSL